MTREMDITEQITYSTVLIRGQDRKGKSVTGTGFIMAICIKGNVGLPVIITNKHVVEKNVITEIELCKADENGNPIDTETIPLKINRHCWISHPEDIDLCCCMLLIVLSNNNVGEKEVFYRALPTNLIPNEGVIKSLKAIEDVIMVGYPYSYDIFDEYNHKPIARRGITATHPNKDYQGKKEILLDIAMFPGSSGSPVFIFTPSYIERNEGCLSVKDRFFLLGIARADCTNRENIFFSLFNKLNTLIGVKSRLYINLALMIKAEKILDFEKILPY